MQTIQKICLVITIIGALNWGLIGFVDFNLIEAIFTNDALARIIYSIVGICGLINTMILFRHIEEDVR